MNPLSIQSFANADELLSEAAAQTLHTLQPTETLGSIVLTGGRTAIGLYQRICELALDIPVRWRNVHFFWGDERCVPMTDPESNFRLAQESLLKPLRIHPCNIHRIPTEPPFDTAAHKASKDYETFLTTSKENALRLILLSIGEDGHIASVFPDGIQRSLEAVQAYSPVVATKLPPHRITLNLNELAQAEEVFILAVGKEKKTVLDASLENTQAPQTPLAHLLRLRNQAEKKTILYRCP